MRFDDTHSQTALIQRDKVWFLLPPLYASLVGLIITNPIKIDAEEERGKYQEGLTQDRRVFS